MISVAAFFPIAGLIALINANAVICETETIDIQTIYQDDPTTEEGKEYVLSYGSPGQKETCKSNSGKITSNTVKVEPINAIISVGSKKVNLEAEANALCVDGTYSFSIGPGTCSWHGGVSRYIY